MKKILLLLLTVSMTAVTYAQFPEDFSGATFPPAGWASFRGTNGSGTTNDWQQADYGGGDMAAYVQYEGGGLNEDWLVTPQFTVDATNYVLSFDQDDTYGTDYLGNYYVKISTATQTTHADFTDLLAQTEADVHTADDLLQNVTVDLSAYIGQNVYIAFVMVQNDGDDWYIDNVNMVSAITCGVVSDVAITNQTTSSFDVNWTAGTPGTASSYTIEYGPIGFTQGTGTPLTSNTTSVNISGLSEATGYEFYIQGDCGATDGLSEWTYGYGFTSATPYNVGCGYNNPSNGVENGASCTSASSRIIAHDIIVPANTTMTLSKIVPHILMAYNLTATVDVTIYDDNAGLPGNVISTQAGIVPTSSKQSGANFGFIVYELELDLTPVVLANATGADLAYWIGVSVTTSDGSNCYWENTSTSLVGSGQAYDDGTVGFVSDAALDGVYSFVASCATASINEDILSSNVSIYPTATKNAFTINNTSDIALTAITIFDINGRVVLTQNLDNLIGEKSINVSKLSTGMYFVQLNAENASVTKKLIKK